MKKRRNFIFSLKMNLIVLPLLIILIAVAAIALISIQETQKNMLEQSRISGHNLVAMAVERMEDNSYALSTVSELMDNTLIASAKVILSQRENMSNELIIELKEELGLYGIYWYNAKAEIIYADLPGDIGWVPEAGHAVNNFFISGLDQAIDREIRENTTAPGQYIKSAYMRARTGEFVQVSIDADKVKQTQDKFSTQGLVEDLASNENIVYAVFIGKDMTATAHSDKERIGIDLSEDPGSIAAVKEEKEYSSEYLYGDDQIPVNDILMPVYNKKSEIIGALNVGVSMNATNIAIEEGIKSMSTVAGVSFVLIGAILMFLIGRTVATINATKNHLNLIATGDFSKDVPKKLLRKKDEFGEVATAIEAMQSAIRVTMKEVADSAAQVQNASEELAKNTSLSSGMANQIALTVDQISIGASGQAKDTELGVTDVNRLGELIEQDQNAISNVTQSVSKINSLKNEGLEVLKDLTRKTEDNSISIREVQGIIINTNESVGKIKAASQVIQDIASQTNLLALNAAIEAARAGEAGRGFSVVSEEIRKLADESNASVAEINGVIADLSARSMKAVETTKELTESVVSQAESVENTNVKFMGISEAVDGMKNAVEELTESGKQMNQQKNEIVSIMQNLSAVAEENAAATEEVTASVVEQTDSIEILSGHSNTLSELAKSLQNSISKFRL